MRLYFILVSLFTVSPIPAYALTLLLSWVSDCHFSEAGPAVCPVAGVDVGGFLYGLFLVAAWGWIVTLPVGGVLLVAGVLYALFKRLGSGRGGDVNNG